MSRALRIEYAGAWYHVMNRGADRNIIFNDPQLFQIFYDILEQVCEKFGLEIHAFCLMNNHYHLLVRTPYANLSRAMCFINGMYARKFNKILKKDGPLFRGRFKAILVDTDRYLLELSRYIHLNPVNAKIVDKPEDYRWSSYKCYLVKKYRPKWLYCDEIMNRFSSKNNINSYAEFVNRGNDSMIEKFYYHSQCFPILGSNEFIQKIKSYHLKPDMNDKFPEYKNISKRCMPSVEAIIDAVGKYYNIDVVLIKKNLAKTNKNEPRNIAIYLAAKFCKENRKEISEFFEGISYLSITSVVRNVGLKLKTNSKIFNDLERIKNNLSLF